MTKMLSASGRLRPWTPLGALPSDPRYRLVLRNRHGASPTTDPFRRLSTLQTQLQTEHATPNQIKSNFICSKHITLNAASGKSS